LRRLRRESTYIEPMKSLLISVKMLRSLVDEVIERFGKLSLDELLNYVYSLDEVKRTGIGEVIL